MRWLVDWLFTYNTRKEHDIHTKQVKKNYWRIRISILYFFYSNSSLSLSSNFLFRQCHCQKSNNFLFLFPSISAMSLPQTNCNKFFFLPSYFCNAITTNFFPSILAHKSIATIFFPPISAMPLPQIYSHNFFSFYFGNAIVTNPLPQIFPPLFQQCITTNQLPLFFFFEKWYVHIIFYNKS